MTTVVAGLPYFNYFDGPVSCGDVVEWDGRAELRLMWINEAGPGTGISLQAWGPAVGTGLVELVAAELVQGAETLDLNVSTLVSDGGERVFAANAPQVKIHAAADWDSPITEATDISRTMLMTRLVFRTRAAGHGRLSIALSAIDANEVEALELELHTRRSG